ncbi:MAG: dockerin type I repeat-containing protein, partial [Planctomycetota bacterium]
LGDLVSEVVVGSDISARDATSCQATSWTEDFADPDLPCWVVPDAGNPVQWSSDGVRVTPDVSIGYLIREFSKVESDAVSFSASVWLGANAGNQYVATRIGRRDRREMYVLDYGRRVDDNLVRLQLYKRDHEIVALNPPRIIHLVDLDVPYSQGLHRVEAERDASGVWSVSLDGDIVASGVDERAVDTVEEPYRVFGFVGPSLVTPDVRLTEVSFQSSGEVLCPGVDDEFTSNPMLDDPWVIERGDFRDRDDALNVVDTLTAVRTSEAVDTVGLEFGGTLRGTGTGYACAFILDYPVFADQNSRSYQLCYGLNGTLRLDRLRAGAGASIDFSIDTGVVTDGDFHDVRAIRSAGWLWTIELDGVAVRTGIFEPSDGGVGRIQSFVGAGLTGSTGGYFRSIHFQPYSCERFFLRGDTDGNTVLEISDAILLLRYLFLGEATPGCLDAADLNDNGRLNIADASYLLAHLFLGGPVPPPPSSATCGADPTPDGLDCASYSSC